MNHLDILLPFGLPPAELAADLFRGLTVPALSSLLARSAAPRTGDGRDELFDEYSRSLPHEIWLARRFGLEDRLRVGGSPPIAMAAMRGLGLTADDGVWFMLNPVHLHIALDHLVLTDVRQLQLAEMESRALFDLAQPLFEEAGKTLLYGNAESWFVRADDWERLQTSTPDATAGHNIDIWMPKGEGERNWRKLQNEVQMHWHSRQANQERESRGLKPVNSMWLWGGAPARMAPATKCYSHAFNLRGWMQPFAQFVPDAVQDATAPEVLAAAPERGLLALDALLAPALTSDWSYWRAGLEQLERDWFAPLLAALKSGKLRSLSLIASDHLRTSTFMTTRQSLRKFWVKPSLAPLLP